MIKLPEGRVFQWRSHEENEATRGVITPYPHMDKFKKADKHPCPVCEIDLKLHGWVQREPKGYVVCPGQWFILSDQNELYGFKPMCIR